MNECRFGTAPDGTPAMIDPNGRVVALWVNDDWEWV